MAHDFRLLHLCASLSGSTNDVQLMCESDPDAAFLAVAVGTSSVLPTMLERKSGRIFPFESCHNQALAAETGSASRIRDLIVNDMKILAHPQSVMSVRSRGIHIFSNLLVQQ